MFLESFDSTKIYYRIKRGRKGKPFLLFLHGWGANWTIWKKEIEYFKKKGYSTLTLDLRGHGRSGKPNHLRYYEVKHFLKDIDELLKLEKIKKVVLIGHSMGGLLSLVFYDMFKSKVKALVLCSTASKDILSHRPFWKRAYPIIETTLKNLGFSIGNAAEFFRIKLKPPKEVKRDFDFTKHTYLSPAKLFFRGWMFHIPLVSVLCSFYTMDNCRTEKVLKKIRVPVLLMVGSKDTAFPEIYTREMYKEIKGSEMSIIKGGTHYAIMEYPQRVNKYILGFLKRLR